MRRLVRWVAVLAIVTLAAVAGALALSHIGAEEQPPCHACVRAGSELPQKSVCELASNDQELAGKLVRVSAKFRNDSAQLFLEDGGCTMHAGFAKERKACGGAWQKLQVTSGVSTWYDGSASVLIVGSLSRIPDGNYYAGEKGFTISCLEEVRTDPVFGQRIRFAIGRVSRAFFGR